MALGKPDEFIHNNPDRALVDSDFTRGGGRRVATLAALYALASKIDQLKIFITKVWVDSEESEFILVDAGNIGNQNGWRNVTVTEGIDEAALNEWFSNQKTNVEQDFADLKFQGETVATSTDIDDLTAIAISIENEVIDLEANKVDKEAGKGLSAENYTADEKEKLASLQQGSLIYEGISATGDSLVNKIVSVSTPAGYTPQAGDILRVKYLAGSVSTSVSLNVNGSGLRQVRLGEGNAGTAAHTILVDRAVIYYFNGTEFEMFGSQRNSVVDPTVTATVRAISTENVEDWNNKASTEYVNNELEGKLNTGGNVGLSGDIDSIPVISPDGTISRTAFLQWIASNRELVIGTLAAPGRLNIASNVFELAVQDNIGDGQAKILFNGGQDNALSFADKDGKIYMSFRTLSNGSAVVIRQAEMFDSGVFWPLMSLQGSIATDGSGARVYALDDMSEIVSVSMGADTTTAVIEATFLVKNVTAAQVICGKITAMAKRVSGTVTVVQSLAIVQNHSNTSYQDWTAGIEALDNNRLQFFFQQGATDPTSYTGAFPEIKFSIN